MSSDPVDPAALEERFVRSFVQAPRQERALFELRSNKKRREFFSRLYHRYADVLVTESMAPLAQSPPTEIVRLLRAHGAAECA